MEEIVSILDIGDNLSRNVPLPHIDPRLSDESSSSSDDPAGNEKRKKSIRHSQ